MTPKIVETKKQTRPFRILLVEDNEGDVDLTRATNGEAKTSSDQTMDWLGKGPVAINFYHYIYHSGADRTEIMNGFIAPYPTYWINYRPYSDERHWDNMGFEVVDNLPGLPAVAEDSVPVSQPVRLAKTERLNFPKHQRSKPDGFIRQNYIKVPIINR